MNNINYLEASEMRRKASEINLNKLKQSRGLLYKTKCTVIGPMQYADGQGIRNYFKQELGKLGIVVFDHYRKPFCDETDEGSTTKEQLFRWMEEEEYDKVAEKKMIRTVDLKLVDISDWIIFYFSPKVMTCGSWEEFFWAARLKKKILFVNVEGKKKSPFWVLWTIPHADIFSSREEAVEYIRKVDSGELPIDGERLKLLKEEFR